MIVYGDRVKGGKLTILSLYIIGCRNSFSGVQKCTRSGAEIIVKVGCRNSFSRRGV